MPTDTIQQSGSALAERQFADYEAYTSYEKKRVRDDELTEMSERINDAMLNTFEYSYGPDGELYYNGESLEPIMRRGIQKAELVAGKHPQFTVELLRRRIEYEQYLAQREVGNQQGDDPLVLVHISPMPDAVNQGADLGAYDAERQKVMVRVTEKTPGGVRVTSMSLDGGNRLGIQSIGDMCGEVVPEDATSEDILAKNFYLTKSEIGGKNPVQAVRQRYDNAMRLQFGGEWYAGRRDGVEGVHTLQFILAQGSETDQYVDAVYALKERYGESFRGSPDYKKLNYDFLSLLNRRKDRPDYAGTAEQAGAEDRSRGVEHDRSDCPTGDNLNKESVEDMLSKLGLGEKRLMSCPFCGSGVYGDPCSADQFCPTCTAEVRGGVVVSKGIGSRGVAARKRAEAERQKRLLATRRQASSSEKRPRSINRCRLYGSAAIRQIIIGIGSAKSRIINQFTKQIYE